MKTIDMNALATITGGISWPTIPNPPTFPNPWPFPRPFPNPSPLPLPNPLPRLGESIGRWAGQQVGRVAGEIMNNNGSK